MQPTPTENNENLGCPNGVISITTPIPRRSSSPTSSADDMLDEFPPPFIDDESRVVAEMIDCVRHTAGISHEKSQIAVQKVLEILQSKCDQDFNSLLTCLQEPSAISRVPEIIENSKDTRQLNFSFGVLSEIRKDEQQRSWATHDDESDIEKVISDIHSILLNADACISKYVMKSNEYVNLHNLALLYQMETRKTIRFSLRNVFITICQIDRDARSILANSILPLELAREFQDCLTDKLRLLDISKLLTLLLPTGETLPPSHFEHLGVDFVTAVMKVIEEEAEDDGNLQNELTNTLLAMNYQHHGCDVTIQAISNVHTAPFFTQRIVNLLNWGKEPLDIEGDPKKILNSYMQMLINIFQNPTAAGLFYTNDVKVLIDVCLRWLADLEPPDRRRPLLLSLIRCILTNTDYSVHLHRKLDLLDRFGSFFTEDEEDSEHCQKLIVAMCSKFPFLKLGQTYDLQSQSLC